MAVILAPTSRFSRASRHSFRRTVASEIDEVYDAEVAKSQLGHTSKTVTERHYINGKLVVPDYRAATERLAPGSGESEDPALGL
jgi:integrase